MRIVFMGTAALSCTILEALGQDKQFQIAAVVTQPDQPKGRGLRMVPSPVKSLALQLGLPVLLPARARDETFIAELRTLNPDLIVVAAYRHLLPQMLLDLPRYGCLNVHMSLLPKYRGAAPIQWPIANGDTETGATIMKMDAGMDTGDIVSQCRTPILPEDDFTSLQDRLARLGAELLVQTIPAYAAGKIQPQPQPAEGISLAPKIKKEDGRIDWNLPAKTIQNRLRAFTPWPGTFTFWKGARAARPRESETRQQGARAPVPGEALPPLQLLKIWKVEGLETSGPPGTILSADKHGIVTACGQDALRILELQPEGSRRMSATEFLAGHPLKAGGAFA